MICPSCGADQPTGARFCNQCGARLPDAPVELPAGTCARCGAVNPPSSKFCAECGAPLAAVALVSAAAPTPAPAEVAPPALTPPPFPMTLVGAAGVAIRFPPSAGNTWLIGRDDPVTGVHPDIDLSALDPERTVSRRHAHIHVDGGRPVLTSAGATNGTKVNGMALSTGQAVPLDDGDRIEFGRCALTFKIEA
jgi:ribosomal protein L40E